MKQWWAWSSAGQDVPLPCLQALNVMKFASFFPLGFASQATSTAYAQQTHRSSVCIREWDTCRRPPLSKTRQVSCPLLGFCSFLFSWQAWHEVRRETYHYLCDMRITLVKFSMYCNLYDCVRTQICNIWYLENMVLYLVFELSWTQQRLRTWSLQISI